MGSGIPFKAKCSICKKKKLIGKRNHEDLVGVGYDLKLQPHRLTCAECLLAMTIGAIRGANQVYLNLRK